MLMNQNTINWEMRSDLDRAHSPLVPPFEHTKSVMAVLFQTKQKIFSRKSHKVSGD